MEIDRANQLRNASLYPFAVSPAQKNTAEGCKDYNVEDDVNPFEAHHLLFSKFLTGSYFSIRQAIVHRASFDSKSVGQSA